MPARRSCRHVGRLAASRQAGPAADLPGLLRIACDHCSEAIVGRRAWLSKLRGPQRFVIWETKANGPKPWAASSLKVMPPIAHAPTSEERLQHRRFLRCAALLLSCEEVVL